MVSDCPPGPKRCARTAGRSPARASRTVVRPGRPNGGTTLLFRLARPAAVHVTIVRVFPSCEKVGSFTVHAKTGVNRVRFNGRFHGKRLPNGGYRLIVRARGAPAQVAAIPIVIASGKTARPQLRRARTTAVCDQPVATFAAVAGDPPAGTSSDGAGPSGMSESVERGLEAPIVGAAGAIAEHARGVAARVRSAADDPRRDAHVLLVVALLLLCCSLAGTMLVLQLARTAGITGRDPLKRP